jgi:diaminopimelate dehydrogenase
VDGVADAIQYTVPSEKIMDEIRNGSVLDYTVRQKHKRVCFVVAKKGADKDKIAKTIKEMPYYFADYDTDVIFISAAELKRDHGRMAHAGTVLRNGTTSKGEEHSMEFSIRFDSNPEFTGSVMAAFARAAFRLYNEKNYGAKTILDLPVSYLSAKSRNELIKEML